MGARHPHPNVVVVMATQWRGQATGYSGDGNAITPFLDRLAEEAIDFTQAVTPHPVGVFARAAFLTGIPSPENGVSDYYDPLPENARTLAHSYGDRGYETAFFGKWQLYVRDPAAPVVGPGHALIEVPSHRRGGFQFWEGFESGFLLNDGYYHGSSIGPPTLIPGYQSDVLAERWTGFLQSRKDAGIPLFGLISLDAPHPPYSEPAGNIPPRDLESLILDGDVPEDPDIRSIVREELAGYYTHIEATDKAIETIVAATKERLDWENTIFVFTSAHGDMHGAGGCFRKGWPHEQSVRVPLLLSWPKMFPAARRDPLLLSLLDLGPTLFGLCFGSNGGDRPSSVSGNDLSEAIQLKAEGPDHQTLSMPSVVPFPKQCPYAWSARRDAHKTEVNPANGERFTLDH